MKRVAIVVSVLGAVLALSWYAGCTQQKKSVLLRLKFEPGQTHVFEINRKHHWMKFNGDSMSAEGTYAIDITAEEQVRRVLAEGTAEIIQTINRRVYEPRMGDPNVIDTMVSTSTLTLYMHPDGRLADLDFGQSGVKDTAYTRQFYEQASTVFPKGPVEQGKTWSHSTHVMLNDEKVEAATTYELKSFAREKGFECAVIAYDGNLLLPIPPMDGDSTLRQGVDRIDVSGMMYFAYVEGVAVSIRERWLIDSDRKMVEGGKWKQYRSKVEVDAEQQLVQSVPK
ncbi:MAG: hypothetical protein RBT76_03055 [candidate division Zixibacteria bacterium]|nr:hypothetical protein [candidate division Zixibacteria bacterium]